MRRARDVLVADCGQTAASALVYNVVTGGRIRALGRPISACDLDALKALQQEVPHAELTVANLRDVLRIKRHQALLGPLTERRWT
jgi:hypothetical protein